MGRVSFGFKTKGKKGKRKLFYNFVFVIDWYYQSKVEYLVNVYKRNVFVMNKYMTLYDLYQNKLDKSMTHLKVPSFYVTKITHIPIYFWKKKDRKRQKDSVVYLDKVSTKIGFKKDRGKGNVFTT